jgi:hypothetical protein
MTAREYRPDVLIIGAPKAGTTALHAALAQHPQIYASPVKEPKYYMCWDAPPPAYRGPGDAHSNQEWIWRRADYEALFRGAPEDAVRLESTPFYLCMPGARRRIAEELPEAKLIVIVRDPIDRAYSNWMHLWVDGLEPISDFVDAWHAEDRRVSAGWAPFWHYRRLGRYGEQLADLFRLAERERVFVLRYWQLVSHPDETLERVARFLGIAKDQVTTIPPDNARPFVEPGLRTSALGRFIRAGATAASYAPPQVWRRASKPLVSLLQHGGHSQRPKLASEQRTELLGDCFDDIALLEQTLGESFADWRSAAGRGSFAERTQTLRHDQ